MRKLIVPDSGEMLVGSLRESVHGMADGDVVFVQGGRYVDPPPPADDDAVVNADAGEDLPKPKRGRRS